MSEIGRTLVVLGLVIVAVGLLLSFAGRLPRLSWLGHLPGDRGVLAAPAALSYNSPTFHVPLAHPLA
jgi:hypothetical protein